MVKSVARDLSKAVKSNRILMIVCAFVVMGAAVVLINHLQRKTLENFAVSAYAEDAELNEAAHGELHADCQHGTHGSQGQCGHAHTAAAATAAGV